MRPHRSNAIPLMLGVSCAAAALSAGEASFLTFAKRAQAGERLSVVFLGGSLTWGANASDQAYTSYRAQVARMLRETYPQARFEFHDAAIGGTGSLLGVFRLERDVLRHKPDLLFLDFTANDGIEGEDVDSLAAYESILRRTIGDARCPVLPVIFPFQYDIDESRFPRMKRREAHLALAEAYGTYAGDAVERVHGRVKSGATTLQKLWPFDPAHPGDEGYLIFAEAAFEAFTRCVKEERVCKLPERPLHGATYLTWSRYRLALAESKPSGWAIVPPLRTAAWHDSVMSRWLDDEVRAQTGKVTDDAESPAEQTKAPVAPWTLRFQAATVLLFGTKTSASGKYRIRIDGAYVQNKDRGPEFDASSAKFGGNVNLCHLVATGLDPERTHELVLEPVFAPGKEQELRIESVCLAGGAARVVP
ncbi:MAG: SGNH/GDSL hydrolase family protein [Planctomycetes bacterium]|nr:SGNH/GDSL hydrolase family protein [Planctomycetota bacterium]